MNNRTIIIDLKSKHSIQRGSDLAFRAEQCGATLIDTKIVGSTKMLVYQDRMLTQYLAEKNTKG
tara:strand:+ start:9363 stop:9554 length:192 start_codon:yes stop_codon:yes gene_type:complete